MYLKPVRRHWSRSTPKSFAIISMRFGRNGRLLTSTAAGQQPRRPTLFNVCQMYRDRSAPTWFPVSSWYWSLCRTATPGRSASGSVGQHHVGLHAFGKLERKLHSCALFRVGGFGGGGSCHLARLAPSPHEDQRTPYAASASGMGESQSVKRGVDDSPTLHRDHGSAADANVQPQENQGIGGLPFPR